MKNPVPDALTIAALSGFYESGGSPQEVVRRVYRRIAEVDDPGIFITLVPQDKALEMAANLPPRDDRKFPLWGIPFAVKDNIDVAGYPTTAACPDYAYIPAEDAIAVRRAVAAGAIMIGKTNLDQFATGLVGVRSSYPIPRNAIDPGLVPGGSSSGSAVAVAHSIVTFSLGTDTAGSGRVPAALNNIVGLKPSVGMIPATGVIPACRTLDCVSIFALTVDDAWTALNVMAGKDSSDVYSKSVPLRISQAPEPAPVIGIPARRDLKFFGDSVQEEAWYAGVRQLERLGANVVAVDFTDFFETAALLYEGPWIAERYAALADVIQKSPEILHPVTRSIIEKAAGFSADALFKAQYRLKALQQSTFSVWSKVSMLAVPTTPASPTLAELAADPVTPNSQCGTYTNFVNLLDLCAIAVPGPFRTDGRAAGLTFIAPSGHDGRLATFGRQFHIACGARLGATEIAIPPERQFRTGPDDLIEIVVVGAHLSGMPLNHELTSNGGVFRRAVSTTADYRFYALAGEGIRRPGLTRVANGTGSEIQTEVWALPPDGFGRFVSGIPAPLSIGTVLLSDGTCPKGFLAEAEGLQGAKDISHLGGWRAFITQDR